MAAGIRLLMVILVAAGAVWLISTWAGSRRENLRDEPS
jgi:hypothetical protein